MTDETEALIAARAKVPPEAVRFVDEALSRAIKAKKAKNGGKTKHVTAGEHLAIVSSSAVEAFGLLAVAVLAEWGIYKAADVGRIVKAGVEEEHYTLQKKDEAEDFDGFGVHHLFAATLANDENIHLRSLVMS